MPKRATFLLMVGRLIIVLGFFWALVWMTAGNQKHSDDKAQMHRAWEQPAIAVTNTGIMAVRNLTRLSLHDG